MKGIRLSKRDLKLFEYLSIYGLLSTQQIRSMVFQNIDKRTVLRRLRKLWKKRYLRRVTDLLKKSLTLDLQGNFRQLFSPVINLLEIEELIRH